MKQKIISYNLNGIRAAMEKGFLTWLKNEDPDILCIQETKAQPDQIDIARFLEIGYTPLIHSAVKKGYSGVAVFSKNKPDYSETGIGISKYDDEGRLIRADFGDITLIGTYFPSGTMGDVRQDFKMKWLSDFTNYINNLRGKRPNLIICGDYNICHKAIDINHPERHTHDSGFLPEERAWFDEFIDSGFIDSFRKYNQQPNQYSWWSYRAGARFKNLGWRIDYNLVSEPLGSRILNAAIYQKVVHSDHCPVMVEVEF